MTSKLNLKYLILFTTGALTYILIELLWRGYSHWTMGVLGGVCFIICGGLNEWFKWETPLWAQVLIADIIILSLEFLTGCIVNLLLGWNVWDYSGLPFNLMGQVCAGFAVLWLPIAAFAIILDDWLRYWWFKEENRIIIFVKGNIIEF